MMHQFRYKKTSKISEGASGVIYKAIDTETNSIVALKKIKFYSAEEGIASNTLREISLMQDLHHQNIIKLKHHVVQNGKLHFVFDYFQSDLCDYIKSHPFNYEYKKMMNQLLQAVDYCHARKIGHRDINPQNILIDDNQNAILGDFGSSRLFCSNQPLTKDVSSLWYRAPEVLIASHHYSTSIDIWSLGCVFAEMVLQAPLLQGICEIDQQMKITELLGNEELSTEKLAELFPAINNLNSFLDLIQKMLTIDPSKRWNAKQLLQHPYLQESMQIE